MSGSVLAKGASTFISNAATDYLPPMAGRAAVEYLGAADPKEPLASPIHADLAGLPPCWCWRKVAR